MIEAGNHPGNEKRIHALRGRRGLEGNDRKAYLARGKGEKNGMMICRKSGGLMVKMETEMGTKGER